jgi:hypothetical protein
MLKTEKHFMLDFVHFPFVPLRKTISRNGAKVALDSRNDAQSPIDTPVSGRQDKNPAKSICTSNYYSEKEPKHVALFFGRDIFFVAESPKYNCGRFWTDQVELHERGSLRVTRAQAVALFYRLFQIRA